jgi:hypothetical protein
MDLGRASAPSTSQGVGSRIGRTVQFYKEVLERVDRDHRSPAFLERAHLGVEMLDLRCGDDGIS